MQHPATAVDYPTTSTTSTTLLRKLHGPPSAFRARDGEVIEGRTLDPPAFRAPDVEAEGFCTIDPPDFRARVVDFVGIVDVVDAAAPAPRPFQSGPRRRARAPRRARGRVSAFDAGGGLCYPQSHPRDTPPRTPETFRHQLPPPRKDELFQVFLPPLAMRLRRENHFMKRTVLLSAFAALLIPLPAFALTATVNSVTWTYFVENDEATIESVPVNASGAISIPAELPDEEGYDVPVTSIADSAFSGCSRVTSVEIPDYVTSVGYNVFSGCSGLTTVSISPTCLLECLTSPRGLRFLGDVFPDNVTTFILYCNGSGNSSHFVFPYNETVQTVRLTGEEIDWTIEPESFSECSGLLNIEVDPGCDTRFMSIGGVLCATSQDYTELVAFPKGRRGNYVVPDSVTIIGNGAFSDCNGLSSVTIPGNVTLIGTSAFEECRGLTSVVLLDGVTKIGTEAFSGCSALSSVSIPSSVQERYVGSDAFKGCSKIEDVTVPGSFQMAVVFSSSYQSITNAVVADGSTSVGGYGGDAFSGCSKLASVTIPDSVTSIGSDAFYGCSDLTSITIPDSVTSIGEYAFGGGCGLTSIAIPNGVTSIENGTFSGCSGLTSIEIPDGVTRIGTYAFSGCSELTISIPSTVTSIGNEAFSSCSGLHVTAAPRWIGCFSSTEKLSFAVKDGVTSIDDYAFRNLSNLISVTIPDSVTSIGREVFSGCSKLTGVFVGSGVTRIGQKAFYNCSSLSEVHLSDLAAWCGIAFEEGQQTTDVSANPLLYAQRLFLGDEEVTALVIPDGVETIGSWAFEGCSRLTSVRVPDSLTAIGNGAFHGCSGLTEPIFNHATFWFMPETFSGSFSISEGVENIADKAFYNCSRLTAVSIPASVESIGSSAFYGCSGLASVAIPNGVTHIGASAFYGCSGLRKITFPGRYVLKNLLGTENCRQITDAVVTSGSSTIASGAFEGCDRLVRVSIPAGVEAIGERAFFGCYGLTSIKIPNGVTSIESETFKGCSGLTSIEIPDGVTRIGNDAFSSCSLVSVEIPNTVIEIGDGAFSDCFDLKNVMIPGRFSLSSVFPYAYPDITNVAISPGSTFVAQEALSGCFSLISITIPDGVTSIGIRAFSRCSGLASVSIPNSVVEIGEDAFVDCTRVENVMIPGRFKLSSIFPLDHAYYQPVLTNVVISPGSTFVAELAFFDDCYELVSVSIPEGVSEIRFGAFAGCAGLESIVIPGSVTNIGNEAFYACHGLSSVFIPANVCSIGNSPFASCSGLESILVDSDNERYCDIDGVLFTKNGDRIVSFPSARTGDYAIPDGVETIGPRTFFACDGLTSLAIPETVKEIGFEAFYGCRELSSIVIPDGVENVDTGSFSRCYALETISIPESLAKQTDSWNLPQECRIVVRFSDVLVNGIRIPKAWFDEEAATIVSECGGDYEMSAIADAANGRPVWECYVAGLSPTNAAARFEARVGFENGEPVVTWTPDLNEGGTKSERVYTVEGKADLGDETWGPTNESTRFFRVKVEMP